MRWTRPATGARFTWQLKTFMKTEMRTRGAVPSSSSGGGTTGPTAETRPSAGLMTRSGSIGVTRGGSRKKYTHQAVRIRPSQNNGPQSQPRNSETKARIAMKGYPSR